MSKTVVVYHSGYGHTQRIAQSVAEGAKLYEQQCVACHGEGAKGGPVYGTMVGGVGSFTGILTYKTAEAVRAAAVGAEAFDHLDAPIRRLNAPFTHVPYSPPLEAAVAISADQIDGAIRGVLRG